MATYQLELVPVTPVHIGSGEELPGYEYYLDDFWYVYTVDSALAALPPPARARVVQIATQNVMGLAPALVEYPDVLRRVAHHVGGYSEAAGARWEESLSGEGQALVQRFVHSQHRAYIPGSSIKGALRTALLFAYTSEIYRQYAGRDANFLEAETFHYDERKLNTDPFRFLKVSDTEPLRDATDLRLLRRVAYKPNERQWVEQVETMAECTQASLSRLQSADVESPLRARLTVDEVAYGAAAHGQRDDDPWRFGIGALLDACRHFWGQNLEAERNYTLGLGSVSGAYQALQAHANQLPDHAALIRLGFGTGRDSKTVNYLQPDPEESRSRLLVDGEWPLGWVEMRVLTAEGKPFTPTDDLAWEVPAIQRHVRRTGAAEKARRADVEAERKAQAHHAQQERQARERQQKLAGDILSFLRRKNDDEE